ncbi:MAG: alpha-amylase, partial [Spirochaetaceae bacterium]|nr:alpha-amylase [Spirochaetaceae bacterium]
IGISGYDALLEEFGKEFPPRDVYQGSTDYGNWLASSSPLSPTGEKISNRELALEELILLKLANENPAFAPFRVSFNDGNRAGGADPDSLSANTLYLQAFAAIEDVSRTMPVFGPEGEKNDIIGLLRMPALMAPDSLAEQLKWIRDNWGATFDSINLDILKSLDLIKEEEAPRFGPGPGPVQPYDYRSLRHEYEKFSPDSDWMPSLVLISKNALVWLHQLSKQYERPIARLDEIPDEELDCIADRGINGLWLIGIWQRSNASEKIKKMCGNPEAAASAYALYDYNIAPELGGWDALDRLRERCLWRGIRLAADMVPNHTGIDSEWMRTRPDLFMGSDFCPYPSYTFNGPDLSDDPGIGIWLEDHYYSRTDAAVVFKRLDRRTGKLRYIYHGNDGTGMAWNDTAQIDFLNPDARAAVRDEILHVAQHFSIIRFDAAMVLAKQHIRRLWYPAPGSGGAIPSRSEYAMNDEAFDRAMPQEFWREVVDECAAKAPDTLLLAEAFWMMEGYFVRTLGMHRVYNSAFMNMLKDEKNSMYRMTVKNTQEFDRQILKRYVNFMNNPDERTAVEQFSKGDKYFGICAVMATLPGLPMFGHGQIEGFTEK